MRGQHGEPAPGLRDDSPHDHRAPAASPVGGGERDRAGRPGVRAASPGLARPQRPRAAPGVDPDGVRLAPAPVDRARPGAGAAALGGPDDPAPAGASLPDLRPRAAADRPRMARPARRAARRAGARRAVSRRPVAASGSVRPRDRLHLATRRRDPVPRARTARAIRVACADQAGPARPGPRLAGDGRSGGPLVAPPGLGTRTRGRTFGLQSARPGYTTPVTPYS